MSADRRTFLKVALAVLCAASIVPYVYSRQRGAVPPPTPPVVTAAEFDLVAIGMTYEDCVAIIGAGGTPYGASEAPGVPISDTEWVSFVWNNSRESSAEVTFNFGLVESKRGYGLR